MKLGVDDFALLLSCGEDDKGKWNGQVDISMYYSHDNKYDKTTNDMLINMMSLMSTCVTMMETDKEFLAKVFRHREFLNDKEENEYTQWQERDRMWKVQEELDKQDKLETKVKDSPKVVSRQGNVINVDWKEV